MPSRVANGTDADGKEQYLANALPDQEAVDEAVGELPHEGLVLLEAFRCDQAQEEVAVCGVRRRVERGQLVTEGEFVAALGDDVADIVAFERHRELDE